MGQVLTVVCVQNTGTCTLHRKATFTFFKKVRIIISFKARNN